MKNKIKYLYLFIAIFALASCETLEETYDEYAGDGSIRYVGTPTNIVITPKWGELDVNWINSIDPNIVNVDVEWKYTTTDSSFTFTERLNAGTVNFAIPVQERHRTAIAGKNFVDTVINVNVEVNIVSVDHNGETSKKLTAYSRPYNVKHEEVIAYPLLISSNVVNKDKLLLIFSDWNERVESISIKYMTASGEQKRDYTKTTLPNSLILDGMVGDSITVERIGYLGDFDLNNPDNNVKRTIVTGVKIENKFSSDWTVLLNEKYPEQKGNYDQAFLNSINTIDIDLAIESIDDILMFPNLKEINFGKNRYMGDYDATDNSVDTTVYYGNVNNIDDSKLALEILDNVNNGIELNFYGKHFNELSDVTAPAVNLRNFARLADTETLTKSYVYINNYFANYEDVEGQNSFISRLFDNRFDRIWDPATVANEIRRFEITVTFDPQKIAGFELTQTMITSNVNVNQMPSIAKIEVSKDNSLWIDISGDDSVRLGRSPNETNVIYIHPDYKDQEYSYARITITDNAVANGNYHVTLAEFSVISSF